MSERELKGPIKTARFIHRAILTESDDLRRTAVSLTADDAGAFAGLNERFEALEWVLKIHEDGEDATIFPPLETKYRYIAETYEYDHRRHRETSSALEETLRALKAGGGRRSELVRVLGEQAAVFDGYMRLHIDKENELLFPTYDATFSAAEQAKHGELAQGKVAPEDMAKASGWMFRILSVDDREGFLRDMMAMLPPPAFAGMSGGLSKAVPAGEWGEMVRRIPSLAGAGAGSR